MCWDMIHISDTCVARLSGNSLSKFGMQAHAWNGTPSRCGDLDELDHVWKQVIRKIIVYYISMYVCACVCVYIYIYIYIYTHTHVCICVHNIVIDCEKPHWGEFNKVLYCSYVVQRKMAPYDTIMMTFCFVERNNLRNSADIRLVSKCSI